MKYIFLLLPFLTACGTSYSIGSIENKYCTGAEKIETTYYCKKKTPMFQFDSIVKACVNLEECNVYCDQMNKENK